MSHHYSSQKRFLHPRKLIWAGLALVGLVLLGYFLIQIFHTPPAPVPVSSSSESSSEPVSSSEPSSQESSSESSSEVEPLYPTDALFLSSERESYRSGEMVLKVPRLDLETPVLDNVDEATLTRGVGLYPYSMPAGRGNRNVSIAGHRDIYGCEFYYIDTITEGDLLYLSYQDTLYTYLYDTTTIVAADDWGPIYFKDYSCLTLTSCDPIGTSLNRIIVTAKLIDTQPLENLGESSSHAAVSSPASDAGLSSAA